MGLMDLLKKFGFLRTGGAAWKDDAKERPISVDGIPVDSEPQLSEDETASASSEEDNRQK